MTEDFECDYADWLEDVAVRVDELGADPVVFNRFRRMLATWKVEHDASGPKSPTDKHGYCLYNEVKILPLRNMTLAHKYAVLAAIHDVICDGVKRMNLWRQRRKFQFSKAKSGTSYDVLQSRVEELTKRNRSRIEKILKEVEADLTALTEDGSPAPSQTHPESSSATAATPSQARRRPDSSDEKRETAPAKGTINTADCPNPSAPMSLRNAADAWGGDMTARKLRQLMNEGKIRFNRLSRQRFEFSRDDCPNMPKR